ncbi:hypothetical protein DRE_04657 [Drechslerella stenobrocha 248]|uniref:F-box domain-containing protein n=1 Tax=Drechslerella stenobrocha 248 TaxID=1043628 RepID=W7I1I8_9PEZI|nr:hypothetical protein DRE_04657 [Drechslerella stenobrocha 248]
MNEYYLPEPGAGPTGQAWTRPRPHVQRQPSNGQILPTEILQQIMELLTNEALKNICLTCSLFRRIGSEFLFKSCVIWYSRRRGLDLRKMEKILKASPETLGCVRDLYIVLDTDWTSEETNGDGDDGEAEYGAGTTERAFMMRRLLETFDSFQLRSIHISRHVYLTPRAAALLADLHPRLRHLTLRIELMDSSAGNEREVAKYNKLLHKSTAWMNLRTLYLNLRGFRDTYRPRTVKLVMQLLAQNFSMLRTFGFEIALGDYPELASIPAREPAWETADAKALLQQELFPDVFEALEQTEYPRVQQLHRLEHLHLVGVPNLRLLYEAFARDVWQPSLLQVLRLDNCKAANQYLDRVAGDLLALRSLAIYRSCTMATVEGALLLLPPLESLFLHLEFFEGWRPVTPSPMGRHEASLRYLWLEFGHLGMEWDRSKEQLTAFLTWMSTWIPPTRAGSEPRLRLPRLEEFAFSYSDIFLETFVKTIIHHSPVRIFRALTGHLWANPLAWDVQAIASAENPYPPLRSVDNMTLRLIVFWCFQKDNLCGWVARNKPEYWLVAYRMGAGGRYQHKLVHSSHREAQIMFPRSPILNYDTSERAWFEVV